jgi:hypothetical protein
MVLTDIQNRYLSKKVVYTGLTHNKKIGMKIKYLYALKKPKRLITWYTTNPDFAEYASRCGMIVTCRSIKSRIIK